MRAAYKALSSRERADQVISEAVADAAVARSLRILPPPLAERARQFIAGQATEVVPRPAATVMLVRERPAGLEVYALKRARSMAFAGGMYAFPGGAVDPRDTDPGVRWAGPSMADWASRLGISAEAEAPALLCAAIRETFEEAGVLLADSEAASSPDPAGTTWEADRVALVAKELAFADFAERRGLVLRTDKLALWAHWITPRFEPRRYDTRFFLAALPPGQQARDVSGEAEHAGWLRPAEALSRLARGEISMLPPTAVTFRELATCNSVAAAFAAAAQRTVRPITPQPVVDADSVHLVLPGEPGWSG